MKTGWILTRHGTMASNMFYKTRREVIETFFDGNLKWFQDACRDHGYGISRVRITLMSKRSKLKKTSH